MSNNENQSTKVRTKHKNLDLLEPLAKRALGRMGPPSIEVTAKTTIANATPYELAMAKAFVNDYTQYEKVYKGKIMPFKSVVHFAAGTLLKPEQYDLVLTEEQKNLLKSVYYEFS